MTHNNVLGLVTLLAEVQVVVDEVRLVGNNLDLHVELTPSLFRNTERGVLEGWLTKNISSRVSRGAH